MPSRPVPRVTDWRTTDAEEVQRRRLRAEREEMFVRNLSPGQPVFSNFAVTSALSGQTYRVEIRQIRPLQCSCTCVDFQVNGLGTCKHVERVLSSLRESLGELFFAESSRIDLVVDAASGRLAIERNLKELPPPLRSFFDITGVAYPELSSEEILADFAKAENPRLRISQEVEGWLEQREREAERIRLRREYEQKVRSRLYPQQETKVPLLPYQREGMLHLAFVERAILADEMGLGKTVQAIAAAALLHRLGKVSRVLVVTPASLKGEWEDQIRLFTDLPQQAVFGPPETRLEAYTHAPFFTLVNYEQVVNDGEDVDRLLAPDCVILDEAQRIKNWESKTAQAVKHLKSRYVFILTGTPVENRLDDIYSLMSIVNPQVLGPLFRFNRAYYELDDAGRPIGCKNLSALRGVLAPYVLRRTRDDVTDELPNRTERVIFSNMAESQRRLYTVHEQRAARLLAARRARALSKDEADALQRELAMMRMICDTPFILDGADRTCPKLAELADTLESALGSPDVKILVFSEWERMLHLVRSLCEERGWGYVWHTGSVPRQKRAEEIRRFKNDPSCRLFLSTDSGGTGLNLQQASVVVNCDLPWTPAKLEQRIHRAWRRYQVRNVTVVNLVCADSIESRMMEVLARKRQLMDGVLDARTEGDGQPQAVSSGEFLDRLSEVVTLPPPPPAEQARHAYDAMRETDPELGFAAVLASELGGRLSVCESYFPAPGKTVLLVVAEGNVKTVETVAAQVRSDWFGARGGSAAPALEVLSPEAYEALKRLLTAGVIQPSRASGRTLYTRETGIGVPKLAPESDKARALSLRRQAAAVYGKARRAIAALAFDTAGQPLCEAVLLLARAWALEHKTPEPRTVQEAVGERFSALWGGSAELLANLAEPGTDPVVIARCLMPFFGG